MSTGAGDAVLVSQFFPPFNIIASQRALRMARVLLAREMNYSEFHNFDPADVRALKSFLSTALEDIEGFRRRESVARLPDFSESLREIVFYVLR